MGKAKDIIVKPISSKDGNRIIKKFHYSGKVVPNSQLHFGVFYKGVCEGAMQFGVSTDIRRMKGLVSDTPWHDFLELNRLAFSDILPTNSESRAIAIAIRTIKKKYPNIKWIVSFADSTQCGDGTIYRASGFKLTSIKKNNQILKMPDGSLVNKKTLDNPNHMAADGRYGSAIAREQGAKPIPGFQLRYIYFIDKSYRQKLTVPEIPFSKIGEMGAGMYKGIKRSKQATDNTNYPAEGQNLPERSIKATA